MHLHVNALPGYRFGQADRVIRTLNAEWAVSTRIISTSIRMGAHPGEVWMDNSIKILTLLLLPGISRATVRLYINKFNTQIGDSAIQILHQLSELKQSKNRIPLPSINVVEEKMVLAKSIITKSNQEGIHAICALDNQFPKYLNTIQDPPVLIYVKGDVAALNAIKRIAIIGTREPSEHGARIAFRLGEIFSQRNFCIISGLASGCDTYGHKGCLKANGQAIAILASGLDRITPVNNIKLAKEIIEKGGALVSEYPIGTAPCKGYFVERDRLQSGASQAIIVVESGIKGGTMRTVGFAKAQGRIIACYNHPREQNNIKSQGNQMLINSGDAYPISTEESILELISKIEKGEENRGTPFHDDEIQMTLFGQL